MTRGGIIKSRLDMTRQGWKRVPRRLLAVKLVPMPKKRKTRKLRWISPAFPKVEKPPRTEVPKIAVGQGGFCDHPSAQGRKACHAEARWEGGSGRGLEAPPGQIFGPIV
jgi:hypothetical protein